MDNSWSWDDETWAEYFRVMDQQQGRDAATHRPAGNRPASFAETWQARLTPVAQPTRPVQYTAPSPNQTDVVIEPREPVDVMEVLGGYAKSIQDLPRRAGERVRDFGIETLSKAFDYLGSDDAREHRNILVRAVVPNAELLGRAVSEVGRAAGDYLSPIIQTAAANLMATPAGQQVISRLNDDETLSRIEGALSSFESFIETFAESREVYEADEFSAKLASWLIDNGIVPFPEETSGAAGRPLMMDIVKGMGYNDIEALGVEMLIPAYIPSLGIVAAAGMAARPVVGLGSMASQNLRNTLREIIGGSPELTARAAQALADVAPTATNITRLDAIPDSFKGSRLFQSSLDEVTKIAAEEGENALRVWRRPDRELFGPDVIPRGDDGFPLPKSKEVPDGLTPKEYERYFQAREEVLRIHGGEQGLEDFLMDAYRSGEQMPGFENTLWYSQQETLDRLTRAVGNDPVLGRAYMNYMNAFHGKYSANSTPKDQARRAALTFLAHANSANPASELRLVPGASSMPHSGQATAMSKAMETGEALNPITTPKTYTYASDNGALSGNLGDITVDVHMGRNFYKDPNMKFEGANALSIGHYLALRDMGMEIAAKHGLTPGIFQERVWIGNAKFTGVGGRKAATLSVEELSEPFDVTMNKALDEVLEFVREQAGLSDSLSLDDVLAIALRGDDPRMTGFLQRLAPNEPFTSAPDAAEALIRTFSSDDIRDVLTSNAARMGGVSSFLSAIADPVGGFRLLPAKQRAAAIDNLADALRRSGSLADEDVSFISTRISNMSDNEFGKFGNAVMTFNRNANEIERSFRAGGFSLDLDTGMVPLIGSFQTTSALNPMQAQAAQAKGFAVSPYPMLGFKTRIGNVENLTSPQLKDLLARYILDVGPILTQPRHGIGGWVDKGTFYLDTVVLTGNQAKAVDLGKQANQISITKFHGVGDDVFLPTGGTGAVPEPPSGVNAREWRIQQALEWNEQVVTPALLKKPGTKVLEPGITYPSSFQKR